MGVKINLVFEALAAFDSKNPMPSHQDAQAILAWRARRNTVEESARAVRNLSRNVEHAIKFAKCDNCLAYSAEWIQSRKAAADAARDKDNAVRAMSKAEKEAYVAAAAIHTPPAAKQNRNFYAKVVNSGNAKSIFLSVQKAVDENPSVIAARASVGRALANEQPPGKREAWFNSDENSFSLKAAVKQRESASAEQVMGALAAISRFVEEAEANNPSVTVVAQTQSATSPNIKAAPKSGSATPVAKPKPTKTKGRPSVSRLKKNNTRR